MEKVMFDGRVVAYRDGNRLIKKGKQVMLFRNYDGFGFSRKLLDDESVEWISLEYDGLVYTASVDTFKEFALSYVNPKAPFDKQLILPRKYWLKTDPDQPQLLGYDT